MTDLKRRAVFVHNGWRIADVMVDGQVDTPDANQPKLENPVSLFLSAYIPLVSTVCARQLHVCVINSRLYRSRSSYC